MVLALVLRQRVGGVGLVAQADVVDELHAALPVAVEDVARAGRMDLVLPADEIPHEIAPVHPVHLIVEEEVQVGAECRLAGRRAGNARPLSVRIGLVECLIAAVRARAPHAREEHLARRLVAGVDRAFDLLVLAVERSPVGRGLQIVGRAVVLAVEERLGAVLLAGEVAHKGEGVVRLVFVGRRLGAGADDVDADHREADRDDGHAQQCGIEENLLLLHRKENSPEEQRQQRGQEEGGAAVVRQAEHIDKEEVEVCRHLRQVGHHHEVDQAQDHHAHGEDLHQFPEVERLVLTLTVVVHKHDGRDDQQVQQVHADAQAHQEGDQHDPAQGVRLVGAVVPDRHQPEHHGGEERRHRVDLTLDGREPEGVGEGINQAAHEAGAEDGDGLPRAVATVSGRAHQALGQPDNGQIQEENRRRGTQRAHRVHENSRVHVVPEQGENAGEQLEHGVSRRMPHLEFIGRRYELAAVPERGGRFYGQQIRDGGDDESDSRADPVPQGKFLLSHNLQMYN